METKEIVQRQEKYGTDRLLQVASCSWNTESVLCCLSWWEMGVFWIIVFCRAIVQGRSQIMKGLNVMYTEFELDSEGNEGILKGSKQEVSNVAT